jgi:hypothetical protein
MRRSRQRVAAQAFDELLPPDDDARLRSAQELVAGEEDKVGARRKAVLHRGLGGQAELRSIHEAAAADVV